MKKQVKRSRRKFIEIEVVAEGIDEGISFLEIQASWLSSLTDPIRPFVNILGNMFVDEEGSKTQQIRANNALLLALYEATHLNRNFVTTLAYPQSDSSAPPSPNNTLGPNATAPTSQNIDVLTAQPFTLLATFLQYWLVFRSIHLYFDGDQSLKNSNYLKYCTFILKT